jgi:hypothetical protein
VAVVVVIVIVVGPVAVGTVAHVIGFGVGGVVSGAAVVKLQTVPVVVPLAFLSSIRQ